MPEIAFIAGAIAGVIAVLGVVVIIRLAAGWLLQAIDRVKARRDAKVAEDRIRRLYEGRQ